MYREVKKVTMATLQNAAPFSQHTYDTHEKAGASESCLKDSAKIPHKLVGGFYVNYYILKTKTLRLFQHVRLEVKCSQ